MANKKSKFWKNKSYLNFKELKNIFIKGYWQKLADTTSETKKLMKEQGVDILPSSNKLTELGYSGLSNAISKYHGGFSKFRELLGQKEPTNKSNGYWTLENTISEAKKVMEEHGLDTLPSVKKIQDLGYGSLNAAISKYHGGSSNFREKHLGEKLSK
jgi:hypothetical protein